MRVVVTGGNGFVGSHLIQHLSSCGVETIGCVRRPVGDEVPGKFILLDSDARLDEHLKEVDVVVHSAGVAHRSGDCEDEMQEGNALWTERIVKAVVGSGVKALIHISSIAAEEAETLPASGGAGKRSPYGRSKLLAEGFVNQLPASGKMGINLRPPLIYGSGAKGNWPRLVALAKAPVPLPFGSVNNRRSFLGISNLCELVISILDRYDRPDLSGTFPVSDDDLVSLREIIRALRDGLGRKEGLFPFPVGLLDGLFRKMGRSAMADGLFQDLRIDASEVKERFGWTPSQATLDGMVSSLSSAIPARI